MSYGERNFAEGTSDTTIDQLYTPTIQKISNTSFSVEINTLGMTGKNNITSYKVIYQKMNYSSGGTIGDGAPLTVISGTNPLTISGLTVNSLYQVTSQAISAAGQGNQYTTLYYLASSDTSVPVKETAYISNSTSISSLSNTTTTSPNQITGGGVATSNLSVKAFLKLDGPKEKNKFTFAYKNFEAVQLGAYTLNSIGSGAFARSVKNYNDAYYSFGTSILFEPSQDYTPQNAGIGFFLNSQNDSGYFVCVKTTGTAAAVNTNAVEIFKLKNKQIKKLEDSQKGNRSTLDQIFAGTTYNIDVKVKVSGLNVVITAYINGFKIEATDTTNSSGSNEILDPTKKTALLAIKGTSKFDYIYSQSITEEKYLQDYQKLNIAYGQFSKNFLDSSYGDLLYNSSNADIDSSVVKEALDEFGTVVRELTKRSVRFSSPPAIPIDWTVGANNLANIVSRSQDNFKADVIVLNNSSTTIPLSDQEVNELSIYGTSIGFSGEIEYSTSPAAPYSNTEPVIFQSAWLQNEKDVKSLAEWIKGRIVNKAKIVEMEVFGNPLISVGDIITVNYPYQGFTTSQKIIIVKVSQSYKEGITTQIVGRTL